MSRPTRAAAVKAASRIRGVYEWEACAEASQRFQQMAAAIEDNFQREEDEGNASEEYDDSAQSDASEDEESEEEGSYESSFVSKSDDDSDLDGDEEYVVPTIHVPEGAEAACEDVDGAPDPQEPGALSPTAIDESQPWNEVLCPDTPGLGYAAHELSEPWTPGAASPPLTSWTPGYYAGRSSLSPSLSPCKRQRLSRCVSGQLRSPSEPGQSGGHTDEPEHVGEEGGAPASPQA